MRRGMESLGEVEHGEKKQKGRTEWWEEENFSAEVAASGPGVELLAATPSSDSKTAFEGSIL